MSDNPTQIHFHCYSLRVIENANSKENSNFKYYTVLASIFDLPRELKDWREINPRDPNTESPVAKAIKHTLATKPDSFFLRNRGLTILAENLEFNNQDNSIVLTMSDIEKHGLLDGGHTFQVIQEYLENSQSKNQSYVKLEIFTGAENIDEVVEIVSARNKSTQVDPASLQNLDGSFDNIKEVLKNEPYYNRIAFKDNEVDDEGNVKDIEILDIISYLACFDVFNYRDHTKNPTVAYSAKGTIPNKFSKNEYKQNIDKITPLLPDILQLRDRIIAELPNNWKGETGKATFGQLKDVGGKKDSQNLPFSGQEIEYSVSGSYYYPILAAFRAAIDSETYNWRYPINDIFNEIFGDIVTDVKARRATIDNLNQLGKDTTLWTACYKTVENYLQTKEIEELRKRLQSQNQK